jgi:tyrosinase
LQFNVWPETLRDPTSSTNPKASSQNSAVDRILDNARPGIRSNLYTLFSAYHTFNDFSNNILSGSGTSGSLEGIHDNIHGIFGTNGGDMGYLDYAAFDPIFWLHHA